MDNLLIEEKESWNKRDSFFLNVGNTKETTEVTINILRRMRKYCGYQWTRERGERDRGGDRGEREVRERERYEISGRHIE